MMTKILVLVCAMSTSNDDCTKQTALEMHEYSTDSGMAGCMIGAETTIASIPGKTLEERRLKILCAPLGQRPARPEGEESLDGPKGDTQ